MKVFFGVAVLLLEDLRFFLHILQVLDGDIAIHAAHDAAAFLLYLGGESLDLRRGFAEKVVEALAEKYVVHGAGGENARVVERTAELGLEFAHALQNP